jgi:hypothetical protein
MKRLFLGLTIGAAALALALVAAWVSRQREFGDEWGGWA